MLIKSSFFRLPSTAQSCLPPDKWAATRVPPVNRSPRPLSHATAAERKPHERDRTPSAALPVPSHQESIWHLSSECRVLAPGGRCHLDILGPPHYGSGRSLRAQRPPLPAQPSKPLLRSVK